MATKKRKNKKPAPTTDPNVARASSLKYTDEPLDEWEIMSAVGMLITDGYHVADVQKEMSDRYKVKMSREKPYYYFQMLAAQGYLRYVAPSCHEIKDELERNFGWLERVHVAHTTISNDVAREAAYMLLRLVQQYHRTHKKKDEVRIGLAAGGSMLSLAGAFAELLQRPVNGLPKRIVFHALVTGHDPGNPTTDPNAFFTLFVRPPTLQVEVEFVGLHAPSMVLTEAIPRLKKNVEIARAFDAARDIDIIVTSGSDWQDEHSSLRACMEASDSTYKTLKNEKTVGDMLWRPIGENGPIETETERRALTLVELSDLPAFIENGKYVLLMLGPCGIRDCNRHKGRILHTILHQKQQLITHLVCDSRTAAWLPEISGK